MTNKAHFFTVLIMKRAILTLFFITAHTITAFAQNIISEEIDAIKTDAEKIASFYPRTEGSKGDSDTRDYIKQKLSENALSFSEISYDRIDNEHSFSGGIEAGIAGELKSELLFIIPLDNRDRAEKGKSGELAIALGLHLLKKYSFGKPPVSMRFLFLGGEHNISNGIPLGSRMFLEEYYPENKTAALYLDFETAPGTMEVRVSGTGVSSPFWLIRRCDIALKQAGLFGKVMNDEIHAFRLGLSGLYSPISEYLREDIPSLYLKGSDYENSQNLDEWLTKFVIFLDDFIRQNREDYPTEWDKNYLYFQSRFFSYLIPESANVLTTLAFFGLLIIYPVVYRKRSYRNIRTLGRNSHYIFIYLITALAISALAKLPTELVALIRGAPTLAADYPRLTVFFQFGISGFLLYIVIRKIIPGPGNGGFYGAMALLLLLLELIIVGFLDISLTYPFAWAFLWAFVYSIVRSSRAKWIFLALSPMLIIVTISDFVSLDSNAIKDIFLKNFFLGGILCAVLVLPFVLLTVRLRVLKLKSTRISGIASYGIISLILAGVIFALSFSTPENIEIFERQEIDSATGTRRIRVTSDYPIKLTEKSKVFEKISSREYLFEDRIAGKTLEINYSKENFLSRQKCKFNITAPEAADRIKIKLEGGEGLIIYNCEYPFLIDTRDNSAEIIIGRSPPLPLEIEIVISNDFSGTADFRVEYVNSPFDYDIGLKDRRLNESTVIYRKIGL